MPGPTGRDATSPPALSLHAYNVSRSTHPRRMSRAPKRTILQ
jgi:hypothetical protein